MNTTRASAQPNAGAHDAQGLSIESFMTDGSLAGLCGEVQRLTGLRVVLTDAGGRRVIRSPHQGAWEVLDGPASAAALGAFSPGSTRVPIRIGPTVIGWMVLDEGEPALAERARESVRRVLELVASTAGELCEYDLSLGDRVRQIEAMVRLTSLLVHEQDVDRILQVALSTTLDVFGLDAGSIVLLPEDFDGVVGGDERDLQLKAASGLSQEWLTNPMPLSRERLFDRIALDGEVVVSEDLRRDPRVLDPSMVSSERLGACLNAGLVFQGEPLGVIRVYARRARRFGKTEQRLLAAIGQQAAVAVHEARLLKLQQRERQMRRQLALARDVQRRMLPRRVPSVPGVDIAARYVPSFELGGDFYDLIEVDGRLFVTVGDVVGKGVPAALLMSSVRASLRAQLQHHTDPAALAARVNRSLCADTLVGEFATLWLGFVDPASRTITDTSAGHDPPMILRASAGYRGEDLPPGGLVIGVERDEAFETRTWPLEPGDVLVAFTDGVTDAVNFERTRFGRAQLRESLETLLCANPGSTAQQIVEHVFWCLRQFAGLSQQPDDQTLVVARMGP